MKKVRYLVFSFIFFTLLLPSPILSAADDPNEVAYQNRFSLKSGTILNSEGKGDCLIFPYYDVRTIGGKHQKTEIRIENVGEYGIVARLRFREWSRGREVFSKDIWIPSNGVWVAEVKINEDESNAIITSFDNTIWRYNSNYFYFTNIVSGGPPFSTKNIGKNNGESTLYGYIEVVGEEKTSPGNDAEKVGRLAKSERDCPNSLMGNAIINRVDEGVTIPYDAVAIGNFSRGQGTLFQPSVSTFPRLDSSEDTLDQLEFQISKCEIRGSYSLDPSAQNRTSMIVTFPTKFFHYPNRSRINQVDNPFEAPKETGGEIVGVTLSEGGEKLIDSEINLPFSVNVIGLYKESTESLTGIDNVPLPTYFSELGEAMLTLDNLSQRFLVSDFENYFEPNQGKFMMYKGLPAVGLVLQESGNSRQPNATFAPVGYSRCFTRSNAEVVLTPATPSGLTFGLIGTSYTFTTGGSSSSLGDPIQYFFDWGDGTNSDWLPVGTISASTDPTKTWTKGGVFTVKVRARCATHTGVVSKWSNGLVVTIEAVSAPTVLTGPVAGMPDQSYTYTASGAISNAGHSLEYQFDWGDGTTSEWGSGTQSKTWTAGGTFTVMARARCATHTNTISNWSNGLTVSIGMETVSVPTTPSGPSFGVVNNYSQSEYPFDKSYSFITGGSNSSLNHPVQYQIDWGDGTTSGWLPVGTISASKTWIKGGVFTVKAMARCATHTDIVSHWSSGFVVTVEEVSPPNMLSGPVTGLPDGSYTYSTGGALSNLSGHQVQYFFDWGDNTNSGWLPVGTTTATKSWPAGKSEGYSVKARARCTTDTLAVSVWTSELKVVIGEQISRPTKPVSVGPNNPNAGQPGQSFTFSTGNAVSSVGHSVEYQFDWKGDGSDLSPWGPATQTKAWNTYGDFLIKARARCVTHPSVVSDWSDGLSFAIELVTTPSQPTGILNGMRGKPYTYTSRGAASTNGHSLEYQFDWGDGSSSPWVGATVDPDTGTSASSQLKVWASSGNFIVKARARCKLHPTIISNWSAGLPVVIEFVSTPVTPSGPTNGTVGEGYPYSTGGSSIPDTDHANAVQYRFDWGDSTNSEWLPIGTTGVGKAWTAPGTYAVRAQARCAIHTEVISDWSPVLSVTIVPWVQLPIETISTPFIEAYGPADRGSIYTAGSVISGRKNILYSFGIRSGVSNLGHTVEHQYDWGDGTFSPWGGRPNKAWPTSGTYLIKVRARCVQHPTVVSDWSSGLYIVIDYITTPSKATWDDQPVDGLGNVGVTYHFSTGGSTSEIGQEIQYRFHWGDTTLSNSGWLPVGTTTASYTYATQGTYTVRVDARGWRYLGPMDTETSTEHFSYYSPELMVTIRKTVVESISTPDVPTGPATGIPGTAYTYSTGGSFSNLGHSVQYLFSWGDGTDSGWLPVGITTAIKYWLTGGTYTVTARARCATDTSVVSNLTSGLTVTIESISTPSTPVGPNSGVVGTDYIYMTGGATSNIGDTIEYQFDWKGDGTDLSSWGSTTQIKNWAAVGTYSVRARARCVIHPSILSAWSNGLTVKIE